MWKRWLLDEGGSQYARIDDDPTELLRVQQKEVKFLFEPNKQLSSSVRLGNVTKDYVAFKESQRALQGTDLDMVILQVMTTSQQKYAVKPSVGLVPPRGVTDIIITMRAQEEAPKDPRCKDMFLIKSVRAANPKSCQAGDSSTSSKADLKKLFDAPDHDEIFQNHLEVRYVLPPPTK